MKKKLISLLLVLALVLSAFPAVVFAADEESNVNPATGREPGPAGNQKVALMVYGETISDAIMKSGYDIDDFWAALKSEAQGILANEKLPELSPVKADGGVARLYRLPGAKGNIGLISPVSAHFCTDCNRLRITADGKIKPCLHSSDEISIKGLSYPDMIETIRDAILAKPKWHGELSYTARSHANRNMNQIGG